MALRRIKVSNFKSFDKFDLELGNFNVLIGANASGKSNFTQLFRFLRDIKNHGLDNAISMQGGTEYLTNMKIGASQELSIELEFAPDGLFERRIPVLSKNPVRMRLHEEAYKFNMAFGRKRVGFDVVEDRLRQKVEFIRLEPKAKKGSPEEKLGEGEITFSQVSRKLKVKLDASHPLPITEDAVLPSFLARPKLAPRTLLLQSPGFFVLSCLAESFFSGLAIYDLTLNRRRRQCQSPEKLNWRKMVPTWQLFSKI